jgi:hypothetical protein
MLPLGVHVPLDCQGHTVPTAPAWRAPACPRRVLWLTPGNVHFVVRHTGCTKGAEGPTGSCKSHGWRSCRYEACEERVKANVAFCALHQMTECEGGGSATAAVAAVALMMPDETSLLLPTVAELSSV